MRQRSKPGKIPYSDAERRLRTDKTVLILFGAGLTLSVLAVGTTLLAAQKIPVSQLVSSFLSAVTASFFIAGIPAFLSRRKIGLTPSKKIVWWLSIVAMVADAVILIGLLVANQLYPEVFDFPTTVPGIIVTGIGFIIVLFFTFLAVGLAAMIVAFGVIGVMSAAERRLTPWILSEIIEQGASQNPSLIGRAVKWLFDIPDVLDSRTLSLAPAAPRGWVGWSDLKAPVFWQLFFGFVLAVYISLNPFFSNRSPQALLAIFSALSTAAILIPVVVLPWFVYKSLGASIKGQTKPFTLFNGIRARIFQSYLALGTIVILVRLSFSEVAVAFATYLTGFAAFTASLLGVSLICTFVYVNYFENDLVEDIIGKFREEGNKE